MIINIRGTNGSGKTTLCKTLLTRYSSSVFNRDDKNKILSYKIDVPFIAKPIYLIGSYENACGGCDGIQPYARIWPLVEEHAKIGHVIFEGILISTCYGAIGKDSEKYGDGFVFAFMDTPVEVCLDRVKTRRESKGNFKPSNPQPLKDKHRTITNLSVKVREEFNRRVVILDHRKAVTQVLGVLCDST